MLKTRTEEAFVARVRCNLNEPRLHAPTIAIKLLCKLIFAHVFLCRVNHCERLFKQRRRLLDGRHLLDDRRVVVGGRRLLQRDARHGRADDGAAVGVRDAVAHDVDGAGRGVVGELGGLAGAVDAAGGGGAKEGVAEALKGALERN